MNQSAAAAADTESTLGPCKPGRPAWHLPLLLLMPREHTGFVWQVCKEQMRVLWYTLRALSDHPLAVSEQNEVFVRVL